MRILACLAATIIAVPLYAQTAQVAAPATRAIVMPEGTEFTVVTGEDLSSKSASNGDVLKLTTDEPATANGVVLVAKGAFARGEVTGVKRAGRMGRAGSMSLKIMSVAAVDGQRVPLRSSKASAGKDHTGATVALTVLFGPLGLLKHGNDAVYKAGTSVKVYTDSTMTIQVPVSPTP